MSKIYGDKVYLSIGEVASEIDRVTSTIKNWYEWAENNDCLDELPEMRTDLDKKGTRYFNAKEMDKMHEFKSKIKYGMLADTNRHKWGERGKHLKE